MVIICSLFRFCCSHYKECPGQMYVGHLVVDMGVHANLISIYCVK